MISNAKLKQCAKRQLHNYVGTYFLTSLLMTLLITVSVITFVGPILLTITFSIGMIAIHFRRCDGKGFKPTDIFCGFDVFGSAVGLSILTGFFLFCWGLIPLAGLILVPMKRYSYAMAPYILASEHCSANEALNKSKQMMEGHKMDLFLLELSFIGWFLLVPLTGGLVGIYAFPYMGLTAANFYKVVSGEGIPSAKEHKRVSSEAYYEPASAGYSTGDYGYASDSASFDGDKTCGFDQMYEHDSASSTAPLMRYCTSCGRTLFGDDICVCQLEASPMRMPKPKTDYNEKFCVYCGKTLHGDEICSCREKSVSGRSAESSTAMPGLTGGFKSTMRKGTKSGTSAPGTKSSSVGGTGFRKPDSL